MLMKIAMIGSGGFANAHLEVLSQEPSIEIVAHVSATPKSREAAAERWGGRSYASCAELLVNERVDAAWITVPPAEHGAIENSFIERNIPLFVEKPLSADRQTAHLIADAITKRKLIVAVGYQLRTMEGLSEVKEILKKTPAHLVQAAWHGSTPSPRWWQDQAGSGGQMVEQATHLFDLARYLVGEAKVLTATADFHARTDYPNMTVADTSTALLAFDKGAKGVFTATCLLEGGSEIYLKLIGEGYLITITLAGITIEDKTGTRELKHANNLLEIQNKAFLKAVKEANSSHLYSSYQDALQTHDLCFDVLEAG